MSPELYGTYSVTPCRSNRKVRSGRKEPSARIRVRWTSPENSLLKVCHEHGRELRPS